MRFFNFKEAKYLKFLASFLLVGTAFWLSGSTLSSKFWTLCLLLIVGPFSYLVHLTAQLTGRDSSTFEPVTWVVMFLYFSTLFQFLLLLFKARKFKYLILVTAVFLVLHGMSAYWFYLQVANLFK